jgi:hypothetical protein
MTESTNYEHVSAVYALPLQFQPENIPQALIDIPNWVVWALVKTNKQKDTDKPTKRPVRLTTSNPLGPIIDVAKWSTPDRQYTFSHCLSIMHKHPNMLSLGFIPSTDNGVVVIDYDNLFQDSTTQELKLGDPRNKYLKQATDMTFVETSVSGMGAHVFLFGTLDNRLNDSANSGVELYPGKRQSFIAMTGNIYDSSPIIGTDQELIDSHVREFFAASSKRSSSSQSSGEYEIPTHIPNGNRNNEMTRLCGYLFNILNSIEEVAAKMFVYNQELCETPLSSDELQSIINSIGARHNAKFSHIVDNVYHIRATNTWFDFNDMTEMTANSLDISHIKEFSGKKGGKPLISKWLAMHPDFKQAADYTWSPVPYHETLRTIDIDGRRLLNTWKGFNLEPKKGTVEPWLRQLEHLIKEPDYRRALLWWIAFTVQKPHIKISWQPIILGISGAGKDALFRPIATIFGSAFKSIGNRDIKGDYDDGLFQTKLLHISEAMGLSGQAIEFYKRITATESSTMQVLNIKGKQKVMQQNICNVLVITNNLDAMKFDKTERRAFVLRAYDVMTEDMQTEYFDNWLDVGGPNYLFDYLLNYDLSEYKPGVRPYCTTHFDAMLDITQNDTEVQLDELLEPYDIALPELVRKMIGGDDRYGITRIKVWLENNGWVRWDGHNPTKRIKRKVNGVYTPTKSRGWYCRKDSMFDGSTPTDMCLEVERIEALFMKKYQ